jgi:hypothetical protein
MYQPMIQGLLSAKEFGKNKIGEDKFSQFKDLPSNLKRKVSNFFTGAMTVSSFAGRIQTDPVAVSQMVTQQRLMTMMPSSLQGFKTALDDKMLSIQARNAVLLERQAALTAQLTARRQALAGAVAILPATSPAPFFVPIRKSYPPAIENNPSSSIRPSVKSLFLFR